MVHAMLATAALGSLFIALKGYEYYVDFVEHMTPFLDASGRDLRRFQCPSSGRSRDGRG